MSKINNLNIINCYFGGTQFQTAFFHGLKVLDFHSDDPDTPDVPDTPDTPDESNLYITSANINHGHFQLSYYWGHNYTMEIDAYLLPIVDGDDTGFFSGSFRGDSPVEICMWSEGYYLDYHEPISTTEPKVNDNDYTTRILRGSSLSSYHNNTHIIMQATTPPNGISMKIINKDTGEIIEDQMTSHYSWIVIGDYYSGEYTTEFFFK